MMLPFVLYHIVPDMCTVTFPLVVLVMFLRMLRLVVPCMLHRVWRHVWYTIVTCPLHVCVNLSCYASSDLLFDLYVTSQCTFHCTLHVTHHLTFQSISCVIVHVTYDLTYHTTVHFTSVVTYQFTAHVAQIVLTSILLAFYQWARATTWRRCIPIILQFMWHFSCYLAFDLSFNRRVITWHVTSKKVRNLNNVDNATCYQECWVRELRSLTFVRVCSLGNTGGERRHGGR